MSFPQEKHIKHMPPHPPKHQATHEQKRKHRHQRTVGGCWYEICIPTAPGHTQPRKSQHSRKILCSSVPNGNATSGGRSRHIVLAKTSFPHGSINIITSDPSRIRSQLEPQGALHRHLTIQRARNEHATVHRPPGSKTL